MKQRLMITPALLHDPPDYLWQNRLFLGSFYLDLTPAIFGFSYHLRKAEPDHYLDQEQGEVYRRISLSIGMEKRFLEPMPTLYALKGLNFPVDRCFT